MLQPVLSAFGLKEETVAITPYGNGLINHTWKITTPHNQYILQRLNQSVFRKPGVIAHNLRIMAAYLKDHHPGYLFVAPLPSANGSDMVYMKEEGYFRLFPFVGGSHSKNVADTPRQAFEAARQFGRFTRLLAGMEVTKLQITIPSFHNLSLRYRQFLQAAKNGSQQRRQACTGLINELLAHSSIEKEYRTILSDPHFRQRVTHHDTKISNVLFDPQDNGLCVIDLDTVMPGFFISDVGDMMRTYISPVSEEEGDLCKVDVRNDFYKAVVDGYYSEMKEELSGAEKKHFYYAGQFMIYMQALRFLTDYLNNDRYYGSRFEQQNLLRAKNQMTLLTRLLQKRPVLSDYR